MCLCCQPMCVQDQMPLQGQPLHVLARQAEELPVRMSKQGVVAEAGEVQIVGEIRRGLGLDAVRSLRPTPALSSVWLAAASAAPQRPQHFLNFFSTAAGTVIVAADLGRLELSHLRDRRRARHHLAFILPEAGPPLRSPQDSRSCL